MKNSFIALLVMCVFSTINIIAEEIEEVVVTSSYIDQTLSEIDNPLHVVSGDDISSSASQSLGESIDGLLGVSSSDFGSGVGQPIIRGMSGNRVKILNNGMVVRDVSGLGADHINDIDLNNIQQIEVVRGPSSLLYSNGSIGGIINVVDNTIAREDFTKAALRIGLESQSVNDGDTNNFSYQNNIGGLNLSFAYKDSQFGNFDIPHGAVIHREEGHHDDDHDEEEDEHDEGIGYLVNSDFESESRRIGISKTGEWGYFGLSVNKIESLYGIPFHGESHEGHDEEDHDEDGHDEEGHGDERIFSTTESDVFNIEGAYQFHNSLVKRIDYFYRDTDYSLTEQHVEGEEEHEEDGHEDEHHSEGPTEFKNDAKEYGAIFDLSNDYFLQKMVINIADEDISIIGVEAFMNPTDNEEKSFGYYISNQLDRFHIDLGIRHDRISRAGSLSHEDHDEHADEDHDEEEHEEEMEYFNRDINNTSLALSLGTDINDNLNLNFGYARVERAPSAVELFMNGPHLATGRFEVGNTNLDSETSNNIDITFEYQNEGFFGELTYFKNNIDNYIYLRDETEEEHEEHEDHEGLILANYLQNDAEINGYEFQLGRVIDLKRGSLTLSFARDSISGKFKDGNNIPRMVPARNMYSILYSENDLELKLNLKDVQGQDNISEGETKTEGYEMLDLQINKTYSLNKEGDLNISLFANNVLDEAARNHSSFVKEEVPLPGRNFGVKFNLRF